MRAGTVAAVIVAFYLILIAIAFSLLVSAPQASAPPLIRLEFDVTPNGIPQAGTWVVSSYMFNQSNDTRYAVNCAITMTATLSDGSKTVETKRTSAGQTSFTVPSSTARVQFSGTYLNNNESLSIYGPAVVKESVGDTTAAAACTAGFGLAAASLRLVRGKDKQKRPSKGVQVVVSAPGLILGCLPLVYLGVNSAAWFGSGWLPYYFLGIIPLWVFALLSPLAGGLTYFFAHVSKGG